ncbi:MAG: amidohydrolase family protein [Candidatus Hydrogenedentes bacterium]|nr:amidohydrolase family protein [Candidatus Hydrogenedentota bacterium]
MTIFDCDAAYGRGTQALPAEIETAADLARELEYFHIDKALVCHRDAALRDFELGNQRLPELDAYPSLHPVLTMAPTCCREMCSAEEFIQRMRAQNIRAVRAFPAQHCYLLDRLSCGDLLDLFVACSIPLLVPLNQFPGQWQGVYQLMRDFPDLTLVVTESGCWGQDRYFRPLMKRYERFHITTSRLETAGQWQDLVQAVGPEHLLFGSALPFNNPGGYVMMLARCAIDDEAKESIAHGNLERLLREVTW